MKQIESEATRNEHALQLLYNTDGMKQIGLSCKLDKSLLTLSDVIKSFGEIIVDSKPNEKTFTKQKDKEAQIMLPHEPSCSIDQITLQLEQTVNTKSSNVGGCTALTDGRMVFTDYNYHGSKVYFVNKDGSEAFAMEVDFAFDVVYIEEDNTVAVTSGCFSQCVNIIDIKKWKVTKTIQVGSDIYGAIKKGHYLIFSAGNKGIRMINLTDETVSDILKVKVSDCSYIAIFNDNLCFTDNYYNTVTCCDFNGTIQWKFKNESLLKNPKGITVDDYGNLYVVGIGSSNVVIISPDGQRYRQIISSEDGLEYPAALHFDNQTNSLLVANYHNSAFLFRIKTIH